MTRSRSNSSSRPESITYVRGAMEGVVLVLVAGLPWAFGGVDPIFELVYSVGIALLVGASVGWGLVLRADSSEPARIARQAAGLTTADPLQSFRGLVSALDERSHPGDVVLVDDPTLYPLIALVEEPSTLLLPYRPEYALAVQQPARFADLIVTTDATALIRRVAPLGTDPTSLPGYRLVTQAGRVTLYERTRR